MIGIAKSPKEAKRILTICEYGNSRSVGLGWMLKHFYNKEVIACGIISTTPETFNLLCDWAESIIITFAPIEPYMPQKFKDKIVVWDVGHDRYFIPPVTELQEQFTNYLEQAGVQKETFNAKQ